ncbi:hypothetical protein G9A89_005573 [Geosiphon pyriformis]|nr:hypothetical protein G9A89_005573 [Geosiphon pyriformis]
MSDYSYLPQQLEEHFEAHNKNDLDFIELNPLSSCLICFPIEEQSSRQFQDFWNWFLNKHSAETYTTYTTYCYVIVDLINDLTVDLIIDLIIDLVVVKIHLFPHCMSDYLYLPQQSEEYFAVHNRNDQSFIKLNPLPSCLICFSLEEQSTETYTAYTTYYFDQAYFKNNFEERNNSINQLLYSATFEQQPPDFEYLNHQIHIWIAAHQATETPFETEEESYQTAPVFDLLSSKSDSSTQTVTSEPMANDPMQANILAALQGIQTALRRRNNTPILLFRDDAQDPIEWLDDFERAATANQYDDEYKFQIVGGYLQGSPATWFSQKTDANAQQRIIRWTPANVREINTSFTTQFENKRTQGSSEVVTKYAKAIRKLIKRVDTGRNWTEEQKIHFFTKGLRTDLSYALWPLLALKDNPTMDMAIELAQRIEDNQRMHLGSTLPVFAPVPVMAPAPQMAATSFATHTQDPNEQLIDRLTANLARLLELLAQAVRENQQPQRPKFEPCFNQPQQLPYQRQQNRGPPVCYCCGLTGHFSRNCNNTPLPLPVPRNNDAQNNRINNNNVPNQRPNHANINFFGEDPLVEATGESASQPEENSFYALNLTDDNHNIDELAINTSESTRKKKKAKVDFIIDPNKASKSTVVKIHFVSYCMDDYLYLPQQLEEHFEAHNKNDLDFIELNPLSSCLICFPIENQFSRQFQNFWNWFLNKHSAETYTAYTTYYFDQAYFEDNFEERNNTTETSFETEEESYQTAPVFDLLSSKSDLSTQTVTSIQANILAALQGIQTALGRKNNTPLLLFRSNAQNPIEWLNDFEKAATANQYDEKYKFQIIGSPATWFLQETDANAQNQIIRWTPTNVGEENTSFTTQFETKFRTPILISKWHMELKRKTQGPGEVVTEYAKAIRKLIKHVDSGRN